MPEVPCVAQVHGLPNTEFVCCFRLATTIPPLFTTLIWNKSFLDCSHRFLRFVRLIWTQCGGCVLCAQVGLATKRSSNTVWPQFGLFVGVNWAQGKKLRSPFWRERAILHEYFLVMPWNYNIWIFTTMNIGVICSIWSIWWMSCISLFCICIYLSLF